MGTNCCKEMDFLNEGELSGSRLAEMEPVSFILAEEDNKVDVEKNEFLAGAILRTRGMDDGKDEPGVKHLPDEGKHLRLIRDLPFIY